MMTDSVEDRTDALCASILAKADRVLISLIEIEHSADDTRVACEGAVEELNKINKTLKRVATGVGICFLIILAIRIIMG